ncbi:MAG: hypothetical protein FIA90_03990 [candidate division NC10 bacterium]|nr:hypothetical protein [Candidatus Methylomirabilis sp.]NJD67827.1 hypothetical protein [candidate division NC10 bacterium]
MSAPSFTRLLKLLFQDPSVHRQAKDRLSDWILDQHALGLPLDGQSLLEHLHTVHPQIFERLRSHPRVKDEIDRVLAAQHPLASRPHEATPSRA